MDTLKHMEANARLPLTKIMIHSDQGSHYTSPQYSGLVTGLGMVQSMSRKGRCIDNAAYRIILWALKG